MYFLQILQVILISSVVLLSGCYSSSKESNSRVDRLPYYQEATFTPVWFESKDDVPDDFHQIPSFSLINQLGDTVTEKSVAGKIYVTDFFFTVCPGICPKMTSNMSLIQEEFLQDETVMLLSHSVTPESDSVSVLKNYAELKGIIADKWHLLTGPRQEIYDLGRSQYFVEEDLGIEKDADEFLHTENFVLVDKDLRIRGIYNGLKKTSINQLIADIKTLKSEN
ncbi:MAG: SCO family protein [Bacteroidota bacterium]